MRATSATLAAEWIKARSIPETWAAALGAIALGVGWATVPSIMRSAEWGQQFAAEPRDQLGPMLWLGVLRLTIVVAIVLGALLLTGDRDSGTAVVTRTVHPHPLRVYLAKTVLAAGWGIVIGALAGAGVLLGVRLAIGPVVDPITTHHMLGASLRVGVATAVCAVLGVAVAALTRSLLATAVIGFVWVWFENLVASMLGGFGDLYRMTPWRNLSYFVDQTGYFEFAWSYHWGIAPLALVTVVLVIVGSFRHIRDNNTIKE